MLINLIDARRGLHDKCFELFANKNIAEQIYCYLCDGIEDCEEAEPVKHGRWRVTPELESWDIVYCSECGEGRWNKKGDNLPNYCYNCGAKMDEVENKLR